MPSGWHLRHPTVRDHVPIAARLEFEELGGLKLKNIARPVEAFCCGPLICRDVDRPSANISAPGCTRPRRTDPRSQCLAFTNMSRDPEQEYLSEGSPTTSSRSFRRIRSLLVISRNSSFTYQDARGCQTGRARTQSSLRVGRQRASSGRAHSGYCPAYALTPTQGIISGLNATNGRMPKSSLCKRNSQRDCSCDRSRYRTCGTTASAAKAARKLGRMGSVSKRLMAPVAA